jgi:hypothetical protein
VVILRSAPRDERDLFIAATHSHLIAFDNLSTVPAWLSDALCRLATGGGFATRQLYSDQDELLLSEVRPVILNGIENVIARPALADRSLFLALRPIPDDQRRPEAEILAHFRADLPFIMGALLDGLVEGLRRRSEVSLARLPRMADFALRATACETCFWESGHFMAAYERMEGRA